MARMVRGLLFFLFCLTVFPAWAGDVRVKDVRLGSQDGGATRFVLETDQPLTYRLFFLADPARAVLDLPPLVWRDRLSPQGRGVVKGWRRGTFGTGTRVVLDLTGPVRMVTTRTLPPASAGQGSRLMLDLAPATPEDFAALRGRSWGEGPGLSPTPTALTSAPPARTPVMASFPVPLPPALPDFRQARKPLIVLDPGHGGVDPGARATNGRDEKDLTLAVARQLALQYEASGRYRVALTRSRDIFIPLPERVVIARRMGADLFISLHADSIDRRTVTGSTIYTLSSQASDREAATMADRENRADLLAGLDQAGNDDGLASLLTSMSYQRSVTQSRELSALLATEMGRVTRLNDRPERAAGFAVLKSPDVPSVLIEMGYLSSPTEARQLFQPEHQRKLIAAILKATDRYFLVRDPAFTTRVVARQ